MELALRLLLLFQTPAPQPLSQIGPMMTGSGRINMHLLSWILSSISVEVFTCVVGLKTCFGAWQSLEKAFGFVSENRQLQLQELTDED